MKAWRRVDRRIRQCWRRPCEFSVIFSNGWGIDILRCTACGTLKREPTP